MFIIGFLGAVLGIGGGFILVPILVYVLRIPTINAIGTSSAVTLATMIFAVILHSVTSHLVDVVLALIMMIGGAVGAQFGARAGQHLPGEALRLLLAVLILGVGMRFAVELTVRPQELYTVRAIERGS